MYTLTLTPGSALAQALGLGLMESRGYRPYDGIDGDYSVSSSGDTLTLRWHSALPAGWSDPPAEADLDAWRLAPEWLDYRRRQRRAEMGRRRQAHVQDSAWGTLIPADVADPARIGFAAHAAMAEDLDALDAVRDAHWAALAGAADIDALEAIPDPELPALTPAGDA